MKEEPQVSINEHFNILTENIRNILNEHNLNNPEILVFIYTKLPKPILRIIENKLQLPDINCPNGESLKRIIKILKGEEREKEERIKINNRILKPYWDKIEKERELQLKRKRIYEQNYDRRKYDEGIEVRYKDQKTILEKYIIAKKVKTGINLHSIANEYNVGIGRLRNWINQIPNYQKIINLNPLFGNYQNVHSSLLLNYQIGQYIEEYDLHSAVEYFGVKLHRAYSAKRWYLDFKAGIFRKIKDPKGDRQNYYKKNIKYEVNDEIKYDLPPVTNISGSQYQLEITNSETKRRNKSTKMYNDCKSESSSSEEIIDKNREEDVEFSHKIFEAKIQQPGTNKKKVPLDVKYETLERLFGIIVLKKKFGFTNKELSNAFHFLSEYAVEDNYQIYLRSGYNGLVRKKINYIVKLYPEEFDPKLVAEVKPHIEGFIQKAMHKDNFMPQLHDIHMHLRNIGFSQVTKAHAVKIMQSIGYSYKKMPVAYADKNKSSVLNQKEIYLKILFTNRERLKEGKGKAEVYLDESFVIDRHIRRFCWMKTPSKNINCVENIEDNKEEDIDDNHNEEERVKVGNYNKFYQICIVGAISKNGWVGVEYPEIERRLLESEEKGVYKYGSLMYFRAQDEDQKDPHLQFNATLFAEYFREQLIPSLDICEHTRNKNKGSLIIMDQCSYHTSIKQGSFNPKKASRSQLLEWLLQKNIICYNQTSLSIYELRKLVEENGGSSKNHLEHILQNYYPQNEQNNHKVLFQPPYHPELNPIEICWGLLKYHILRDYSLIDSQYICKNDLPSRFHQITPGMIQKLYKRLDLVIFTQENLSLEQSHLTNLARSKCLNDKTITILAKKWKLN